MSLSRTIDDIPSMMAIYFRCHIQCDLTANNNNNHMQDEKQENEKK